ncbi:MAG: hypothetical protein HC884_19330 [Chloroflexaceae bacterium]|nr:hypothetical protein [Chloroflexaceae bacterium]
MTTALHRTISALLRARRYRGKRLIIGTMLVGFVLLNVEACIQAHAVTHFVTEAPSASDLRTAPLSDKLALLVTGVPVARPTNTQTPMDHYLPYEVHRIALPNAEQLESWYVPHPNPAGIVILFVGYAGAKEGDLTPAAHLYQWGYSSLLVDFRGAGGSSCSDTTLGMREADDVAAAMAYVQHHWPNRPSSCMACRWVGRPSFVRLPSTIFTRRPSLWRSSLIGC